MGQLRRNADCRGRPTSAPFIKSRHDLPSSRASVTRASSRRRPSCAKKAMTQDDLLSFLVERMHNMPSRNPQRAVPQETPSANTQRNLGDVHASRWETMPRYSRFYDADKAQVEDARQGEIGRNAGVQPCARSRPSKRIQRPKSADPHCHLSVSAYAATCSQSAQRRLGPAEQVEDNAHVEPISGAQWMEKLERRIERATNLAPGSLKTAVLLARPTDVDGAEGTADRAAPPRPSRPSSASHSSRPNSAARIRVRPSSAARPWSARTDKTTDQQSFVVVGAAHGARTFLTPAQRASALLQKAQVDEEWKELGVLEVESQSDSEDSLSSSSKYTTPTDASWEKRLALRLGQRGSSRHPVSPVSARDPPSFFQRC